MTFEHIDGKLEIIPPGPPDILPIRLRRGAVRNPVHAKCRRIR